MGGTIRWSQKLITECIKTEQRSAMLDGKSDTECCLKPAAHKARFLRFFPAASTLHAIWRRGHAHSRHPTCGNAAHEALRREKVMFDAAFVRFS